MQEDNPGDLATTRNSIYPVAFFSPDRSAATEVYLSDPLTRALLEFFETKGIAALKLEDREERWYDDWVAYQQQHGMYAALLSPARYSNRGASFDLLRYARFLECFAYCSPAHGYSLQVTFLGLLSILMGSNEELKEEAVAALESGKFLAFGVSEKDHGSDLLANEFTIAQALRPSAFSRGWQSSQPYRRCRCSSRFAEPDGR